MRGWLQEDGFADLILRDINLIPPYFESSYPLTHPPSSLLFTWNMEKQSHPEADDPSDNTSKSWVLY